MNKALGMVAIAAALCVPSAVTAYAADTAAVREAPPSNEAQGGVRIGFLACDVGEGGGYLLGSAKELDCEFRSSMEGDGIDTYVGTIKKFGVDLGYTARGRLVWAVFAPTAGYHNGSLRGTYLGAAAEATIGAGLGANVLLGGTGGSIQLQPISVTGQLGLNVAAAGTTVTLKAVR